VWVFSHWIPLCGLCQQIWQRSYFYHFQDIGGQNGANTQNFYFFILNLILIELFIIRFLIKFPVCVFQTDFNLLNGSKGSLNYNTMVQGKEIKEIHISKMSLMLINFLRFSNNNNRKYDLNSKCLTYILILMHAGNLLHVTYSQTSI
jgi:hypothetical protein